MLIKGIEIPPELLHARDSGNLVVFAGAGVSVPSPSSLPLFRGLADQIGVSTGVVRKEDEPDERYLGRLKKRGVHVHDAAARILVNDETKPHELHKLLVKLFPSAEMLRIVTTNFDTHFSAAAREIMGPEVKIFYAPALPLGEDFSGLVYLHGCAGSDPARCVLTDEDFGRAYLTQAWASRFLAAMFSRYSVLFVGYSHNDTVMNYLTRGLPPVNQKNRFVFTTEDAQELDKWEFLGIKPLSYRLSKESNPHQAISTSVGEWVGELNRGLLEKGQRIRSIAESQPPLEGEDSDYIKFVLSDLATAQIFFKWAKAPEWISWLEKNQFVQPLFSPQGQTTDFHRVLALWLTENFFTDQMQEFLALIQRNSGKLHPQMSWFIWRRLCMRDRAPLSGQVFAQWTGVLLMQSHEILLFDDWAQLLTHCHYPEDKSVLILLFEFLTRARMSIKERWFALSDNDPQKVEFELGFSRELDYWLSQAWKTLIKPNLKDYAFQLESIVMNAFMSAHGLLTIHGRTDGIRDPFYFHRQSIEKLNENGFETILDLLIDAARDIVRLYAETQPMQAQALIDKFLLAGVPVLLRLAIFGYGKRADISADEKLQWLLQNSFIYKFKTDVFEFLQGSYRAASDGLKKRVIERGMEGPDREMNAGLEDRSRDYEIYNFLVWLKRIAPDCPLADEKLKILRDLHPDFGEREHPELDYWCGGVQSIDPMDGLNLDEAEAGQPEKFLDELLAWKPRNPFERSRASYCSAVSHIATKNLEWGISWIRVLIARKLNAADLWNCVCQGWRNATFDPEQWRRVLGLVETIEAPMEFFRSFVEVLEHGSRREQNALPEDQMEIAQRIAERIWRVALEESPPVQTPIHSDWLTTAINETGGKLAEFWLQRISTSRKASGDSWSGLPKSIESGLAPMLEGKSGAASTARIVFASQLHYFFSLDASFTQAKILPLFDWDIDPIRAEQCWNGFMFWGRWLPGFQNLLLPHFTATINRIASFPKELREHLVGHVAGVAIFRIQDPMADDWLPSVLRMFEDKDREKLAQQFDSLLNDTASAITESVWERWFKRYWEMRLLGIPSPLLKIEANKMVSWPLGFGKYFPEAVKLAVSSKELVAFEHSDLFYRLEKKNIARAYPRATAELVQYFLETRPKYLYLSDEARAVWKSLKESGLSAVLLKNIREAMLALGFDPEEN